MANLVTNWSQMLQYEETTVETGRFMNTMIRFFGLNPKFVTLFRDLIATFKKSIATKKGVPIYENSRKPELIYCSI